MACLPHFLGKSALSFTSQLLKWGEFCWKLDPFTDIIRVAVVENNGHFLFNGCWTCGISAALTGDADVDKNDGNFDFSFQSADLLDNGWSGNFHAKFNNTLNGSWKFNRNNGFSNSGTFTFLATCPAGSAPDVAGPTANNP